MKNVVVEVYATPTVYDLVLQVTTSRVIVRKKLMMITMKCTFQANPPI